MSSSKVTTTIEIAAPPQAVWDVVMDPKRLGDWVTIHRGLGAHGRDHMEQTLHIRGVNLHVTWDLAQVDEPRLAVWEGRGPARSKAHTLYRFTETPQGTTVFDYVSDFKAPLGPLGAVASRALVGGVPEREAKASLQRLKALVEEG